MDIRQIREIGRAVERDWGDVDHREELLPAIAEAALAGTDSGDTLNFDEVVGWLQDPELDVHNAGDPQFGDLPLALYRGRRVLVQLLVWSRGMTEIHQHSFSGAFKIIKGSSIQSLYEVEIEREVCESLLIVDSQLSKVELLRKNDVRAIQPGWGLTHATFHLEEPTVTLLIRSVGGANAGPLHMLASPRLAFAPETVRLDGDTRSIAQAIGLMHRIGEPDLAGIVSRCLASLDFPHVLDVLYLAKGLPLDREAICERLRPSHGELVDFLPELFEEFDRFSSVRRIGRGMKDADDWFLIVMLLLSIHHADVRTLISDRFGRTDIEQLYEEFVDGLPWLMSVPVRDLLSSSQRAPELVN